LSLKISLSRLKWIVNSKLSKNHFGGECEAAVRDVATEVGNVVEFVNLWIHGKSSSRDNKGKLGSGIAEGLVLFLYELAHESAYQICTLMGVMGDVGALWPYLYILFV